ncbi:MAG: hypothetical protein AAB851_01305 [Patescibacteria group bacterium]
MDKKVLWQALNSFCGLLLAVFLAAHILGISAVLISPETFDAYAQALEKSYLAKAAIWLVLPALIFHAAYGIKTASEVYKEPSKAAGYMLKTKSRLNLLWIFQVLSGSALVVFLAIHLWLNFLIGGEINSQNISQKLQNPIYHSFYFFFLAALIFHIVFGVRLILVKYGIGTIRQRKIIIGVSAVIAGAFVILAFAGLGKLILIIGGGDGKGLF